MTIKDYNANEEKFEKGSQSKANKKPEKDIMDEVFIDEGGYNTPQPSQKRIVPKVVKTREAGEDKKGWLKKLVNRKDNKKSKGREM